MKKIILFTSFFICTLSVYSQSSLIKTVSGYSSNAYAVYAYVDTIFQDYYIKDTILTYGVAIRDNGKIKNSQYCEVWEDGKPVTKYTPNQINEYKFYQGRVYVAKDIRLLDSVRRVFLERIVSGKLTLYYYEDAHVKTYFVEKDSSGIVELPNCNNKNECYREQLKKITADSENLQDDCNSVSYNQNSLARLIKNYNKNIKVFPIQNYGFLIGGEYLYFNNAVNQQADMRAFESFSNNTVLLGIYFQQPIFNSLYSLRFDLHYVAHNFNVFIRKYNTDYTFRGTYTSIKMPIMLNRDYRINKKNSLMLNYGILGIYNFQNSAELNSKIMEKLHNDFLIGFTVGTAYKYNLRNRNNLFCELRYNINYNIFNEKQFKGMSSVNLITGVTF